MRYPNYHRTARTVALLAAIGLHAGPAPAEFDLVEGKRLFDEEEFGGNGRTCVTCHSVRTGTISPEDVQERLAANPNDPLFLHDGSDDGISGTTRIAAHATIRVGIELPREADGDLNTVTIVGDESATEVTFFRGVPSTIDTPALDPILMYDQRDHTLQCQALGAIMGHAQNSIAPTDDELDAIAQFQQNDPRFFSSPQMQAFADQCSRPESGVPGCPDPTSQPARPGDTTTTCFPRPPLPAASAAADRGRQMFLDVPLAPPSKIGLCAACHSGAMLNQPNGLSEHLTDPNGALLPPRGATTATAGVSERNLIGNPVFTFKVEREGEEPLFVTSPDPGMLLNTGFTDPFPADFEKNFFKIPQLWGSADTAPYFHDNSAKTIAEMVEHYDWFLKNIPPFAFHYSEGFTEQEKSDLEAFMLPEPGRVGSLMAGTLGLVALGRLRRGRG